MEDSPKELTRIPTEAEEKPVQGWAGHLFKNKALHCRPRHLFPLSDLQEAEGVWVNRIELYLANFCEPVRNIANEIHCVACNQRLTGPQGMRQWKNFNPAQALAIDAASPTGECRCTGCGYPGRAVHEIRMPDGRLIVRVEWLPLQYHPTTLSRNGPMV